MLFKKDIGKMLFKKISQKCFSKRYCKNERQILRDILGIFLNDPG